MTGGGTVELRLNLAQDKPETSDRLKKAAAKKTAATETMDDAWLRILSMKNSEPDQARLIEVKAAMQDGVLGRLPSDAAKRFSKAEALRLYKGLAESQREGKLAELVAKTPANYVLVDNHAKLAQMISDIEASEIIGFDSETFGKDGGALDPWRGNVAGFSVTANNMNYYVPLNHVEKTELTEAEIIAAIKEPLEAAKTGMHNAPFDCKWFYVKYGIDLATNLHADTRIMAMALDENRDHRLKNLLTDWLKVPSDNFDELFPNTQFNEVPLEVALPYAAGDTEKTLMLYEWIMRHLDTPELADIKYLLFEVEMPVCRQFIKSDLRGIRFDTQKANELDAKFEVEEMELYEKITEMFGEEINLNSPAQLKRKLFGDLGLTDIANGSTGVKILKKIKREHPVIPLMMEYRGVGKLRQAFTQKLPKEVKSDGKIHPWHNSWGAATGRFTCKNPNTQQIPAKRPEVRHLFLATDADRILVSIDYSQIELRVLAHVANEDILIKAFENGQDIHSTTAALISAGRFSYKDIEAGKDDEGSAEQKFRKQAKIVNFGIVYGMGAGALADNLEINKKEAQKLIDDYFRGYPGIKRYMDEQHRLVKKQGYVTDIFGRKRRLHREMKSREKWKILSAERMAGNFPIQASAGSILKKAIVDMQPVLPKHDSYILLQVHDELVLDCPRNISEEALDEIRSTMENAVKLVCPVRCDVELNPERWLEKVKNDDWFREDEGDE
ncbi:DNA-directed DNA polymerase [Peribacillus butanolivorans]|uniref:DNA polymerase I n=1 Tax=Peribacillus butanolivorans TaxID=421767 RepID=A0ABM6XNV2_9BACI|nr:DNA-directed DNA polymerase [Peribacillus butanolivorans]